MTFLSHFISFRFLPYAVVFPISSSASLYPVSLDFTYAISLDLSSLPIPHNLPIFLSFSLSPSLFCSLSLSSTLVISRSFLSPAFSSSLPSRSLLSVPFFSAKSLSKTRCFLPLSSLVFFYLSHTILLPSSRLLSHLLSFLHVFRFLSFSVISVDSPLFRRIILPLSSISSLNLSRHLHFFFPNTSSHTLRHLLPLSYRSLAICVSLSLSLSLSTLSYFILIL